MCCRLHASNFHVAQINVLHGQIKRICLSVTSLLHFRTLAASSASGYEGSYVEYDCKVGFETFGCSLLIVFQIVTTNDWQEIMLGAMLDAGKAYAVFLLMPRSHHLCNIHVSQF